MAYCVNTLLSATLSDMYEPCSLTHPEILELKSKLIITFLTEQSVKLKKEEIEYLISKISSHLALRDSIYACS